jgi:hypothetical protein
MSNFSLRYYCSLVLVKSIMSYLRPVNNYVHVRKSKCGFYSVLSQTFVETNQFWNSDKQHENGRRALKLLREQ